VTWKKTFGFHPLLAYLDRPDISGGEGLAGLLRAGNAGSNTTADHVTVLEMALAALPAHARPRPGDVGSPAVLVRTDAAGATHGFAKALREKGCSFSLGFPVNHDTQTAILAVGEAGWTPAYDIDGDPRDGAAGRRHHRDARAERLAEGLPGDRAAGTTAPRGATTVHRR